VRCAATQGMFWKHPCNPLSVCNQSKNSFQELLAQWLMKCRYFSFRRVNASGGWMWNGIAVVTSFGVKKVLLGEKSGWADRMHNGKKITVLCHLPGARDRAIYSESACRHSRYFSSTEVLAHGKRPSGKVISDRFFPPVKGNTSQANPKVPMKFPKNDLTIYFPTEIFRKVWLNGNFPWSNHLFSKHLTLFPILTVQPDLDYKRFNVSRSAFSGRLRV